MAPEPVKNTDPTIGKLVSDVSRDISTLISKEIELAKTELKVSVRFGIIGAAAFVVAGLLAVLAVIILSVGFAYLINWKGHGLALQWCFLIVAGAYFLLAGLAALVGIRKIKKVGPPEKAIEQGKEIPKALKGTPKPHKPELAKKS